MLVSLFGLAALALTANGLYAVIAHGVSQRTRELGVRIAVGARPRDVLRLVIGPGIRVGALGVAAGLAANFLFGRSMQRLLFGVKPADPATLVVRRDLCLQSPSSPHGCRRAARYGLIRCRRFGWNEPAVFSSRA